MGSNRTSFNSSTTISGYDYFKTKIHYLIIHLIRITKANREIQYLCETNFCESLNSIRFNSYDGGELKVSTCIGRQCFASITHFSQAFHIYIVKMSSCRKENLFPTVGNKRNIYTRERLNPSICVLELINFSTISLALS